MPAVRATSGETNATISLFRKVMMNTMIAEAEGHFPVPRNDSVRKHNGWSGCYVAAGLDGRHSNQLRTALMNTPLPYASSQRRRLLFEESQAARL
jgi:hypothetical protein